MEKGDLKEVIVEGVTFYYCNVGHSCYEIYDSQKNCIADNIDGWKGVKIWLQMNYKKYMPDRIHVKTHW